MPLILRIHTYRKQAPATPVEKSFDPLGGTIGRGPGNDLVLNDDSKFISRTHCKIDFRDGGYFLTDLGSNPSLINQRPVGNGKQVRIGHGDVLDIGEYQLNAIVADAGGAAANPLPLSPLSAAPAASPSLYGNASPDFHSTLETSPGMFDPLAGAKILDVGAGLGGHVGANHDPLGLGGEPVLDPLADPLFGRPGAAKPHPGAFIGSENDHLAAQHMPMPAFQPLIPDDFLAPLPASAPVPASANPAAAIRPVQTFIPDDFDLLAPAPAPAAAYSASIPAPMPAPAYPPAALPQGFDPLAPTATPAAALPANFDPLASPALPSHVAGAAAATPALGQHFDPLAPSGQSSAAQFDPLAGTASAANFDPLAPAPKTSLAANFDPLGAAPHAAPASVAHDFDPLGMPAPAALAPIPAPVPAPAPVFAPIPAPIPAPAPVFAPIPAPVPAPIAAPFAPIAAPVAAHVPSVQRGANDGEVMAALLRGLGLPEMKTKLSDPQLAELVGAMLREAVDGTMGVLTARSMTKREIRIEATMIASKGNNPMKFFPDSEAALSQMLTNAWAGYMPGVKAMNNAFEDLRAHEMATIAGMRAALGGVLARFDPAAIEARLAEPTVMDKMMASKRKAKMWDRMVELYGQMSNEAEDDFQRLFGEKFAAAYEEQTDRIRQLKK